MAIDYSALPSYGDDQFQPKKEEPKKEPDQSGQDFSGIDRLIKEEGADKYAPLIRSIHQQESGGGKADTSQPNYAGARGPMQIIKGTFDSLKAQGRIPKEYQWDNPDHSARGGIALIKYLGEKFGDDPEKIAAAYYAGEGAVRGGKVQANLRDLKNSKAPTVGQYVKSVLSRMVPEAKADEAPAAPAETPTWESIQNSEEYKNHTVDEKEKVRNAYFAQFVAPNIPDGVDPMAVRASFDKETELPLSERWFGKGTALGNAKAGIENLITGWKGQTQIAKGTVENANQRAAVDALTAMDAIDNGVPEQAVREQFKGSGVTTTALASQYAMSQPEQRAALRAQATAMAEQSGALRDAAFGAARLYAEEVRQNKGTEPDFTDIRTVNDFGQWLIARAPAGVVSSVPGIVAGYVTKNPGVMAAVMFPMNAGGELQNRFNYAEQANDPRRFRSADRAAEALAARDQNVAGYVEQTLPQTAVSGAAQTALDVVAGPEAWALKEPAKQTAKQIAGNVVKSVAGEGTTGGTQEFVSIATERQLGEQTGDALTKENVKRVVNAAADEAAGAFGAAPVQVGMDVRQNKQLDTLEGKAAKVRELAAKLRSGKPLDAGEVLDQTQTQGGPVAVRKDNAPATVATEGQPVAETREKVDVTPDMVLDKGDEGPGKRPELPAPKAEPKQIENRPTPDGWSNVLLVDKDGNVMRQTADEAATADDQRQQAEEMGQLPTRVSAARRGMESKASEYEANQRLAERAVPGFTSPTTGKTPAEVLAPRQKPAQPAPKKKKFFGLFSVNERGTYPTTKESVERAVKLFSDAYKGASNLKINVVPTPADAVADGAQSGTEGIYFGKDGEVVLVASEIKNPSRAIEVLAHEIVGHHGIESLVSYVAEQTGTDFDVRWNQLLDDVKRLRPSGKYASMEKVRDTYGEFTSNEDLFAREVLARMAEKGEKNSFVQRAVTIIRDVMRALGLKVKMNEADLVNFVRKAEKHVKSGKNRITEDTKALHGEGAESKSAEEDRIDRIFRKPEKLLDQKNWAVLTAENPNNTEATPEDNAKRTKALISELKRLGIPYREVKGRYSEPGKPEENSVMILANEGTARDLGRKFGQESVLTPRGLVYRDGSVNPAKGVTVHADQPENYYTRIQTSSGDKFFTVDIDFDTKQKPQGAAVPQGINPQYLTEQERSEMTEADAENLAAVWLELPDTEDYAAAAYAGRVKKGWYRQSAEALTRIFGPDAPRFAALLAALSPQTSVEANLLNAVYTWRNWVKAGRPTSPAKIEAILGRSVQGDKGRDSVLDAWINNSIRALTIDDPSSIVLSGPKVDSFFRNLTGNVDEVTNDAWMAAFSMVDQALFRGAARGSKVEKLGKKGGGYLAMNVKVREAADMLTKLTGEPWTPAEVQETVWSWAKTLYELRQKAGEKRTTMELLLDGEVTNALLAATPDFNTLLRDKAYAKILKGAGYDVDTEGSDQGAGQPAEKQGARGQAAEALGDRQAQIDLRNAERLERRFNSGEEVQGLDESRKRRGLKSEAPGLTVTAVHYSRSPIREVDTAFFGTGYKGSAREQIMSHPDRRLRRRASFYVDKGTGIRPEAGVGSHAHKATLTNIYDANADPLKLRSGDARAFESKLLDLGFSGYLDRLEGTQPGQVILLGDQRVPVEYLGSSNALRTDMPKVPRTGMKSMIGAKADVNAKRLLDLLGQQLYGKMERMGDVSVKELFQNSFDAVKDAQQRGLIKQGKITFKLVKPDGSDAELFESSRTLEITDNGNGMSPKTVVDAFLRVAGTEKANSRASGGLGIAKAQFLFGNEKLFVDTVRDGERTTLATTGDELRASMEDGGKEIKLRTEKTSFPNGTTIRITIPETFVDPATGDTKPIAPFQWSANSYESLRRSPLFEDVEVTYNNKPLDSGANFPVDEYTPFAKVKFDWGTARIIVSKEGSPVGRYSNNFHVLSNGIHQFSGKITQQPGDPWGETIPFDVYVNIEPDVKPDEPGYPFALNRQQFSSAASRGMEELKNYIWLAYNKGNSADVANKFGDVEVITDNGKFNRRMDAEPKITAKNSSDALIPRPNDKVEVVDGRIVLNGRQLPELTGEALKKMKPDASAYRIPQGEVPTKATLVRDNTDNDMLKRAREKFGDEPNKFIAEVGKLFKRIRDALYQHSEAGDLPHFAGIQDVGVGVNFEKTDKGALYGVHIRVPFQAMFINPVQTTLGNVKNEKNARKMARSIVDTMLHEAVHHPVRGHDADFVNLYGDVYSTMFESEHIDLQSEVTALAKSLLAHKDMILFMTEEFNAAKPRYKTLEGSERARGSSGYAADDGQARGDGGREGGGASAPARGRRGLESKRLNERSYYSTEDTTDYGSIARSTPEWIKASDDFERLAREYEEAKPLIHKRNTEDIIKRLQGQGYKGDPEDTRQMAQIVALQELPKDKELMSIAAKMNEARETMQRIVMAGFPSDYSPFHQAANQQRAYYKSPKFLRWFKKSKAVDSKGNPLVIFHGTVQDVKEFITTPDAERDAVRNGDPSLQRLKDNKGYTGRLGTWFAAPNESGDYDPGNAEFTAEYIGGTYRATGNDDYGMGSNVMPVHLSIQNPMEYDGWADFAGDRSNNGIIDDADALRAKLIKEGYDGIVIRDSNTDGNQFRDDWIAFYPEQIKSAIGNNGNFNPKRKAITESRATERPASADRSGLLDALFKGAIKPVTDKLWTPLYDRLIRTGASIIPERVKHGLVSDYGLEEPYLDAKVDRAAEINKRIRQTDNLLDALAGLDREQSRIAYHWMQEKPDTAAEKRLLAQLPADSRAALENMKKLIDQLGQEAVKVGLLTPESFERNRMSYLHRMYAEHLSKGGDSVAMVAKRNAAIRAENFKGRGLRDNVKDDDLIKHTEELEKGDRFVRLEKRDASGKLVGKVYIKVGDVVPQQYAGWQKDGVWEARFFDKKKEVGMWRDLTPEERLRLGEIEEVRFSFAKTILNGVRDIENARFLKWVADTYGKDEAEIRPDKIIEVSTGYNSLKTYKADEWVKVPDGYIKGTKIKRYGPLAGKYVPAPIWNDIRNQMAYPEHELAKMFDGLMRRWKVAKTALSPAVHTNNVLSNFILADAADVRATDVAKALRLIIDSKRGDPRAKAMWERFEDSGADYGHFASVELRDKFVEPLLKELENIQNDEVGMLTVAQIVDLLRGGEIALATNAAWRKMRGDKAAIPFNKLIDLYQQEDSVFRLAKFVREVEAGSSDKEAGKAARDAFLNYDINAPWVQAARRTALPFIAFSYRAIPIMSNLAGRKPWKPAKWLSVGMLLNAAAYSMLGASGDEDKERKLLPEEMQGRLLGVFPRMVRMPWNDKHGAPVFLDARRWVPGGDTLDLNQSHAVIPMPSWLSVGGPLSLMTEFFTNQSGFTGQKIVKDTDTWPERAAKASDWAFKWMAPNLPLPGPGTVLPVDRGQLQTYAAQGIIDAATGRTDPFGREMSTPQSIASALGVKVKSYPEDSMKQRIVIDFQSKQAEIERNIKALARERSRNGISETEYQRRLEREREKLRDASAELRGRLQ